MLFHLVYIQERLGLLGPNGAGKTTTLQMLLGITTPTSGKIRAFGLDFNKNRKEILMQVNFSSTYVSLPFSLTVMENLKVFAGLYGIRKPRERIMDLLKTFEIEGLKNHLVRKLSSGQITRVCLAKALLNEPKVLFLINILVAFCFFAWNFKVVKEKGLLAKVGE